MGTMLVARCECGYMHGPIMQGGGFASFTTHDMQPAYCERCREMVVLNYMAQRPRCPTCGGRSVFYNDPSLRKVPEDGKPERSVSRWGDFVLPDTEYRCPQCGEMRMRFEDCGCWD